MVKGTLLCTLRTILNKAVDDEQEGMRFQWERNTPSTTRSETCLDSVALVYNEGG